MITMTDDELVTALMLTASRRNTIEISTWLLMDLREKKKKKKSNYGVRFLLMSPMTAPAIRHWRTEYHVLTC